MKIFGQCWRQVLTCQSLGDFFVDDNVDFHSTLGGCLKHAVDSVLLVPGWRST